MTIRVIADREAQELVDDPEFLRKWRALAAACPWTTYYQDVSFVRSWYVHYRAQFAPLIVVGYEPGGALVWLLTLATDRTVGRIVVAGAHQAEYQCWLADAPGNHDFLAQSLRAIASRSRQRVFRFKFIPAGLKEQLDDFLAAAGFPARVRIVRSPIIDLNAIPPVWDSLRKSANKSRLSRLRRAGPVEVRLEHEANRLDSVLTGIERMYDLRQGSTNDVCPFLEDANKSAFHRELSSAAGGFAWLLLGVGGNIIAAMGGPLYRGVFGNGIISHSPFAARHSPSKLLLLLGGKALHENGVREVDLTPGGDWKWRFANAGKDVAEISFYMSPSAHAIARATDALAPPAKRALDLVGIAPATLRSWFVAVRKLTPGKAVNRARAALAGSTPREFRIYSRKADAPTTLGSDPWPFKVDSIADFLSFEPTESWQTRQAFLRTVLDRFESGVHGYSYVENGTLVHSGWMAERQTDAHFTEVNRSYRYPPGSSVLYDFYTHPSARNRGLYQAAISRMLADAAHVPGTERVYISVLASNGASRHVIEKLGFAYVESLYG